MNAEFLAGRAGRARAGLMSKAVLAVGAAVVMGGGSLHAAPRAVAVPVAQADHGVGEQDTGMSGSQSGPQSGGPAMDQQDEGQPRRPAGGAGSNGSSAAGLSDGQGKRTGNDTQKTPSDGTAGMSDSAKGAAVNSDKGPGHRGNDTKPGH